MSRIAFMKWLEGDNLFRMIPPLPGRLFARSVYTHWNVGGRKLVICRRADDGHCQDCDAGDKRHLRHYFNVEAVRDPQRALVAVATERVYDQIINCTPVINPRGEYLINLRRSGTGFQTKYDVMRGKRLGKVSPRLVQAQTDLMDLFPDSLTPVERAALIVKAVLSE